MNWLLLGIAILVWRTLWGLGLSCLLLPQGMRRYALVFAPLAGAALQMIVVWVGAHLDLPGTVAYAWWSCLLPLGLLFEAGRRMGLKRLTDRPARLLRWGGMVAVMVIALAVTILPASQFGKDPTTVSLGGCDAGSYAAAAEALKHYAASDRSGFMGQVGPNLEMPELGIHQWWMNYDHFGPAAVLAMTATFLDRDVFKILTLDAATYWAMLLPMVFWVARQGFGFGSRSALAVTLIMAVSPIGQYVVHHGLLGQLMATGAAVMLWWASAGLLQRTSEWRWWSFVGWAVVGNVILIGSYAFFLPLAYAPLLMNAGLTVIWPNARKGDSNRLRRSAQTLDWGRGMGTALLLAGSLFGARVLALPYLYSDLSDHGYGWLIPSFNFAGFMGGFVDWQLAPMGTGASLGLAVVVIAALIALARLGRLERRWFRGAIAIVVGAIVVYGLFLVGLLGGGKQSSYQAFKVIAVAYPLVFLIFASGVRLMDAKKPATGLAGGMLALGLLGLNAHSTSYLVERMQQAPLAVDSMLGAVRRINDLQQVTSVNIRFPEVWPRLWSSAYLLKDFQYYEEPTYEGRLVTPLAGEWDLSYATIRVIPAQASDQIWLNPMYHLTRHAEAQKVRGDFVRGWHKEETLHHHRWRWSNGVGRVELTNTTSMDLAVTLKISAARSISGQVAIRLDDGEVFRGFCADEPGEMAEIATILRPGKHTLDFDPLMEIEMTEGTGRKLGLALYHVDIHLPAKVPGLN